MDDAYVGGDGQDQIQNTSMEDLFITGFLPIIVSNLVTLLLITKIHNALLK